MFGLRVTSTFLLAALLAGCSGSSSGGDPARQLVDDGPPRWARLYQSLDPQWQPEREVVKLQSFPFMVMWEVNEFAPGVEATPAQRTAAQELIEACFEAAQRHGWFDYEKGLADGYEALPGDLQHFRKNELLFDDAILDPDRPEVLMYYETPSGYELAGVMFMMGSRLERGPQIGGPLTLWHYHVWAQPRCVDDQANSSGFVKEGEPCPAGFQPFHRSYEMMHVWLIDRPRGPFSSGMKVGQTELARALAKRKRERGF